MPLVPCKATPEAANALDKLGCCYGCLHQPVHAIKIAVCPDQPFKVIIAFFLDAATTQSSSVQFQTSSNGTPTAAILNGVGAQATFQNNAGKVVVVTNNSPGTVNIPIAGGSGEPSIPSGSGLTVVSNDPSIPSTAGSSSSPSTAGWLPLPHAVTHVACVYDVFALSSFICTYYATCEAVYGPQCLLGMLRLR